MMLTIRLNSTNHHYSDRRARPSNVAYLEKTAFTASIMFIPVPSFQFFGLRIALVDGGR